MRKKLVVPELGTALSPRAVWGFAALLILLHFVLGSLAREIGLHVVRDDARYILLARSLAGLEYRDIYLVDAPVHTLYPPVFPVLLLAWSRVFGESFAAFTMLGVGLSAAALGLQFAGLKRITSPGVALLCLAALAVNPFLVARAGSVRSEVTYMFFTLLALWLVAGGRAGPPGVPAAGGREIGDQDGAGLPHGGGSGAWAAPLAIGAAILATLTRINGLTLVAAMAIAWLLARRYRALGGLAVASLVTIGAWLAWSTLTAVTLPESNYFQDIARMAPGDTDLASTLWTRTGERVWRLFAGSIPWMLPLPTVEGTWIDNAALSGMAIASLAAGSVILVRKWPAAGLYLLLYGASLFVWPFLRGRFIEVVLPLLVPAVILGSGGLAGASRSSWRTPTLVAAAVLLTATGAVKTAGFVRHQLGCEPFQLADPPACLNEEQSSLLLALHAVNEKAPPRAVFISTMPEPLYYHTGRKSTSWPAARRVRHEDFVAYLREQGVDWILLTSGSRGISTRLLPNCGELVLEGTFPPRTYLLRIPGSDEAPTPEAACTAVSEHRERSTVD